MKHLLPLALLISVCTAAPALSQTIVGDSTSVVNPDALLELVSTNRGLLMPRLALTATNQAAPLTSHVAGMTVYNTATAGSGSTAVSPGLYFNDGTGWIRLGGTSAVTTLYTGDGTLTGTRTVNMAGHSLNYSGGGQIHFNVSGIKVGSNPSAIDPSAMLELENPNKAFYLCRVSLTGANDMTTVPNPKAGMIVYNTSTTAGGAFGVTPGPYYFNGTIWVLMGCCAYTVFD